MASSSCSGSRRAPVPNWSTARGWNWARAACASSPLATATASPPRPTPIWTWSTSPSPARAGRACARGTPATCPTGTPVWRRRATSVSPDPNARPWRAAASAWPPGRAPAWPSKPFLLQLVQIVVPLGPASRDGGPPAWLAQAVAAMREPRWFRRGPLAFAQLGGRTQAHLSRAIRRLVRLHPDRVDQPAAPGVGRRPPARQRRADPGHRAWRRLRQPRPLLPRFPPSICHHAAAVAAASAATRRRLKRHPRAGVGGVEGLPVTV